MCSDSRCRLLRLEMLPSSVAPVGGHLMRQGISRQTRRHYHRVQCYEYVIYMAQAPDNANITGASRSCLHTGTALP